MKNKPYKFQKDIANIIAHSIHRSGIVCINIPVGYGKLIIMEQVLKELKRLNKPVKIHLNKLRKQGLL